jgi:GNAT superfamily N-acetyltransferase
VWVIACLLVHPAHRRQGVARRLVVAAVDHVREQGGRAVEAYPRRAEHRLHDEEAWLGTPALLEGCGFSQVAGEGPYPVMRRVIED